MVILGIDGRMSELVVATVAIATCRLRWREFVASRDVVGDVTARMSSSKKTLRAHEDDDMALYFV
jgi:hypothetical protein